MLAEVTAASEVAPGLGVPVAYRVARRRAETGDVATLGLEPVDVPIGDPRPGQFTMLYAFGIGEAPISVSGVPGDGGLLHHTVRAAGPTTRALQQLEPGAVVGVRGPFGRGWPAVGELAPGRDLVIVGGGVGLAPLRPVVHAALVHRRSLGRVAVLVGARTPADLLYGAELDRWHADGALDLAVTVDAASPSWRGRVGVVTDLVAAAPIDPARTTAVVCGPEVMMRVVARSLIDRGIEPDDIHVSLERNMHCAVRRCGRCQLGQIFVCSEGPVVPWSIAGPLLAVRRW